MSRNLGIVTAFCLLAASSVTAASSVEAKQRSFAAGKDRANVAVAGNRKAMKRKAVIRQAAKPKSLSLVGKKQASPIAVARTPVDKNDCIGAAQTSYARAQVLFRRKKQSIPRDFEQVISGLNQLCGEEEFEKARTSLEWMNGCLASLSTGSCSVDRHYLCAIDPRLEACLTPQRRTEGQNASR
jgi:hypothetical protein